VPKRVLEFFIRIGSNAKRPDMENLGVEKGGGIGFDISDEGPDKGLGFAAPGANEYPVSPMDVTEDQILRSKFFRIGFSKFIYPFRFHHRNLLPSIIISNFWEKEDKKRVSMIKVC
jgi:hypothetical protein